jgi:hypothetical protein
MFVQSERWVQPKESFLTALTIPVVLLRRAIVLFSFSISKGKFRRPHVFLPASIYRFAL